jgi:ribosomal protein L17
MNLKNDIEVFLAKKAAKNSTATVTNIVDSLAVYDRVEIVTELSKMRDAGEVVEHIIPPSGKRGRPASRRYSLKKVLVAV